MTKEALISAFEPLISAVLATDLSAPDAAARITAAGDWGPLADAVRAAHAAGWLTPRTSPEGIGFGRLIKPTDHPSGASVDVVDMADVAGAPHTHPTGEVSLCVPLAGSPHFEGSTGGIVVMPPGSRHVPTTTGGRMVIAYVLPGGAMVWG